MAQGKVYFIGAGPGDPELLTLKGKKALEKSDVVIYAGSLVNIALLARAKKGARIIDSSGLDLAVIAGEMIAAARAGKKVARVHTGEPSLYGAIAEQIEILEKKNIPYEIIPGVSAAFAAAASLHIEYTLPEISQTLILTRRGGRTMVPESESLQALAAHRASMAIFLSIGMIDDVVRELVQGGYVGETPAAVVCRASWPDEKKITGTLATIASQAKQAGISRQAVILVGEAVGRGLKAGSKLYDAGFSHGFRQEARKGTAVVAVTRRGRHTAMRMLRALDGAHLFLPLKLQGDEAIPQAYFYDDIKLLIGRIFHDYSQLVLFMATGIAVRLIAPYISSKWLDPAVVVIDDSGKNSISLLSGHWGGANDLAQKLALVLGGKAVITTESDIAGFPAVDMLVKALTCGRKPDDSSMLKHIQTAVLEGQSVGFYPKALRFFSGMEGHANLHFFDSTDELLAAGCRAAIIACGHGMGPVELKKHYYMVTIRDLVVGMGCHKGTGADEIEKGISEVLSALGLAIASVGLVCSIDKKSREKGILDYCRRHDVPVKFFSADEINAVKAPTPASKHALKVMGVHGVAEPCAILGSRGGKLLTHKIKLKNMTVTVARVPLREMLEQHGM